MVPKSGTIRLCHSSLTRPLCFQSDATKQLTIIVTKGDKGEEIRREAQSWPCVSVSPFQPGLADEVGRHDDRASSSWLLIVSQCSGACLLHRLVGELVACRGLQRAAFLVQMSRSRELAKWHEAPSKGHAAKSPARRHILAEQMVFIRTESLSVKGLGS